MLFPLMMWVLNLILNKATGEPLFETVANVFLLVAVYRYTLLLFVKKVDKVAEPVPCDIHKWVYTEGNDVLSCEVCKKKPSEVV
jgi:hypothetical protein